MAGGRWDDDQMVWSSRLPASCLLPPAPASCLLPPASCRLPPAACLLPPASCRLPPAACLLPPASCRLPPAACRLPPAACLLPPASCRLPPAACLLPPASCRLPPLLPPAVAFAILWPSQLRTECHLLLIDIRERSDMQSCRRWCLCSSLPIIKQLLTSGPFCESFGSGS